MRVIITGTSLQVKSMLRDQAESTMDMRMIEEMSIEQLDRETIQSYRNRHTDPLNQGIHGQI